MSELEQYHREYACTGVWADPDKALCGCRGGWWLSEVDTWHQCPYHGAGKPHPEEEDVAPRVHAVPQPVALPVADDGIPF